MLGWPRTGYMNRWWRKWSRNLQNVWKTCSHYRKTSLKTATLIRIWTSTYWSLWQTYFILSTETLTPQSLYQLSILHTLLFLDVTQFLWSQFLLLLAFLHLYHAQSPHLNESIHYFHTNTGNSFNDDDDDDDVIMKIMIFHSLLTSSLEFNLFLSSLLSNISNSCHNRLLIKQIKNCIHSCSLKWNHQLKIKITTQSS